MSGESKVEENDKCIDIAYSDQVMEDDVRTFLDQVVESFDQHRELRYIHFLKVWHEMKFGLIFLAKSGIQKLIKFTESIFGFVSSIAAYGDTCDGHFLAIRVAAIFLLYALHAKQPVRPKCHIVLDFSMVQNINEFIKEQKRNKHFDVVYVWFKMIDNKAFFFSATTKRVGIEIGLANLSRCKSSSTRQNDAKCDNDNFEDKLESLMAYVESLPDVIKKIDSRYRKMMSIVCKDAPVMSEDKLFVEELRALNSKTNNDTIGVVSADINDTLLSRRQRIRNEAFGTSNPSHLQKMRNKINEATNKDTSASSWLFKGGNDSLVCLNDDDDDDEYSNQDGE